MTIETQQETQTVSTSRQCLKCGHIGTFGSLRVAQACPSCGAIYDKVDAARREAVPAPAPTALPEPTLVSAAPASRPASPATPSREHFIEQLRARSNYPAFRRVVGVIEILFYILAGGTFVAGIITAFAFERSAPMIIGSTLMAIFFYVVGRVGKEVSLMVADMSDAAVHMAERQAQP